jgi:excisionase family DNA binding protein
MDAIKEHLDAAEAASTWTVRDVARFLRVHPRTVMRYIKDGLPAHKPGRGATAQLRFDPEEVQAWFRSRCFAQRDGAAA